jgi:hypothetical protein
MSMTPGGQDFNTPSSSVTGTTSAPVSGLSPSTQYCFVVRATDQAGNEDTNTVEHCATTFSSSGSDTTPPVFDGLSFASPYSSSIVSLGWDQATDDVTTPSKIVYLIYMATSSGGQNFESPTKTYQGALNTYVTGLAPCTTYYFVVRAMDQAGNIDENFVERAATTLGCIDLFPDNVVNGPSVFTFDVINNSTTSANNVFVCYIYGEAVYGWSSAETWTVDIPGSSFVTLTDEVYIWTDFIIYVDPFDGIPEIDETNNTYCSGAFCTTPPNPLTECFGSSPMM